MNYGKRLTAIPHIGTQRFDCHVHTQASFDSDADIIEVCEAALAAGLHGIAITDHVEMADFDHNGSAEAAAQSWESSTRARAAYADRLQILRGVELSVPLYDQAKSESLLAQYHYDFVLAAVHQLNDEPDYYYMDASNWSASDVHSMLSLYFQEILKVVHWGQFDVLAHLNYPVRYLPEVLRPEDYTPWAEWLNPIYTMLAARGLGMEINTSNLRKGIEETSPPTALIEDFRTCGGTLITWGSDAHTPAEVGRFNG